MCSHRRPMPEPVRRTRSRRTNRTAAQRPCPGSGPGASLPHRRFLSRVDQGEEAIPRSTRGPKSEEARAGSPLCSVAWQRLLAFTAMTSRCYAEEKTGCAAAAERAPTRLPSGMPVSGGARGTRPRVARRPRSGSPCPQSRSARPDPAVAAVRRFSAGASRTTAGRRHRRAAPSNSSAAIASSTPGGLGGRRPVRPVRGAARPVRTRRLEGAQESDGTPITPPGG